MAAIAILEMARRATKGREVVGNDLSSALAPEETMSDRRPVEGDLRVWWIPQVPMNAFYVDVETKAQGEWLCAVLAAYDTFQYENNVKPDYSNVGGVQIFEDGVWSDVDEDDDQKAAWVRVP